MLELKNIKKSYTTGDFTQVALNNVNLKFRNHEFVAILGPSGSGKTTLLNIIGGLDRYDIGDLIINNKSTKDFKDADWDAYRNNCVGFIFQSYNLISHISVLENVEMGLTLSGVDKETRRKKSEEVLIRVGLKDHLHKKPNQLSGGQMQRVAIARALANDPDVILADEPTGALDTKTSIQIMELIKEIAKEKLVIMVTHNPDLANKYSNRIVEFRDGNLISDSNTVKDTEKKSEGFNFKKTSMNLLTALKLSFNNIITKKGRTLITAFASSIGIIGIALILSLSNGFDKQITKFEETTLSNFPIMITPQAMEIDIEQMKAQEQSMMGGTDENEYPDVDVIYPYDSQENTMIHQNLINEKYIDFLEKLNPKHVSGLSYTRITNITLLNKVKDQVNLIKTNDIGFTSLPKSLSEKDNYLTEGFDILEGRLPENKYEVVIKVDNKNNLEKSIIEALGLDAEEKEIKLSNLINHEFKIVLNNELYKDMGQIFMMNNDFNELYNKEQSIIIKVVGVVRPNEDNKLDNMQSGMGSGIHGSIYYQNDLIEEIIEINKISEITKRQTEANYNILSGQPFSTEEEKQQILNVIGATDIPVVIQIYPTNFETKDEILSTLDSYNKGLEVEDQIIYTDLAAEVSNLSGSIMDGITIVLIAFSAISLIVSSIMIGIITYISVLERTKEIGILRSLGARKKDITRVFNAETFIIGLASGLLGISIAYLLTIPANAILYKLTTLKNVAQLDPTHALILIAISITLTLIGGFIPAKMASRKDPVEALRTE